MKAARGHEERHRRSHYVGLDRTDEEHAGRLKARLRLVGGRDTLFELIARRPAMKSARHSTLTAIALLMSTWADVGAAADSVEAAIEPRSDSQLAGRATFSEEDDGVKVAIEVAHAPPGPKGAHIHENGDCSAGDASSAGDHFNPDGHAHARPPEAPRHLGDLGNIEITPAGDGSLEIIVKGANLKPGDPHSFLDRAVVIHAARDDGGQPSGNAGSRIGCGVIEQK
jgi:superoxide dismutase, Cu-Zn family